MSIDYLVNHPPTDLESDPTYVLGTCNLEPVVMEMVSKFGQDTPETALIERILYFDPDFDLVWETQFEPEVHPDISPILKWGLLTLFAQNPAWVEEAGFDSEEHIFMRWQHATRMLLQLAESVNRATPWLYGWAMLGCDLLSYFRREPLIVWDKRVAASVARCSIDAEAGRVSTDELPWTLDELRELGVGDEAIVGLEATLVEMLLLPGLYEPTLAPLSCEIRVPEPDEADRSCGETPQLLN